jgi:type II secretory pathway component GspD/PulD (secretin)
MISPVMLVSSKSSKALGLPVFLACLLIAASSLFAQAAPAQQPGAARAAQLYQQGQTAERAGDWEGAFRDYAEASGLAPDDRPIRVRLEVARFQVVQQLTGRAQQELLSGQKDRARETLRSALQIDPTYTPARDLLEQIQQQQTFAGNLPPLPMASGPPQVAPAAGERNFDYRGPTRGAYEEIARQFGLLVSFDADLSDRDVRFPVSDVDFRTAVDLLSQQTGTFWVAVDAHSFFVTADTTDKRNQYAPEITVSIPLSAAESTDDMTETTRVVRDITGVRRSNLDTGTHTLTLRDTPENIALARELLQDIDQPRGEVLLDIDLLEVDRDAAQKFGITPPSSGKTFTLSTGQVRQLQNAQNNGTLLQVLQSIFGTQNPLASSTNLAALLPPLIIFGGGNSTFLATLPGATADFSRSLSVVKQAQRVLLRAKDGQPATLFVGEKFPITLALLSSSLLAGQTQFTPGISPGAFPRTDFPTGASPDAVAVADFNGDGKLDLAVVNQSDNSVSILLGDGKGGFSSPTNFPTAAGPVAIATGDFDRDGHLDLAIADSTAGVVSVLRGNGDGTFAAAVSLPAGVGPAAILSKDLDKNGTADLIVANRGDNTISVYNGFGDGTFSTRQNFAVGNAPVSLAAGDFNNDGKIDLAVANQSSNNVSILKGAGDGTFLERTDLAAGTAPSAVDIADFNGDSRLDLAVANQGDNTISVFIGDGNGGFTTRNDLKTGGGPAALMAADFNGDQVADLVTANQSDNTVSVFLSLGNGSFTNLLSLPTGNAPVALAAGDLNGDGRLDLIVSNRASNNVTVTLNATTVPVSPNAPLTNYPASEYVDLGLKVNATPRIHSGDEVTLKLQFEISALTGQNVNGIPIIGNRVVEQMVRLRVNETSVLAGIIQSNELRSATGFGGQNVAGSAVTSHDNTQSQTELLIAITPRQLRLGPREGRLLYAGRGEGPAAPAQPTPVIQPGETNVPPPPVQPNAPPPNVPAPGTQPAPGPQPQPGNLPAPPVVRPQAFPPDNEAPPPQQPAPQLPPGPG